MPSGSRKLYLVAVALLVIFGVTAFTIAATKPLHAQGQAQTMRAKLEQLKVEIEENGYIVAFDLAAPTADGERQLVIGDISDESEKTITEIGDDYFCFSAKVSMGLIQFRCIPFSNLASVSHLRL